MRSVLTSWLVLMVACSGDTRDAAVDSGDIAAVDSGDLAAVDSGDIAAVDSGDSAAVDSGDSAAVDSGETDTVSADPGSFRWDLGAVRPADFYAYPWPSDLRTLPNGAADLSAFSTERAKTSILADAIHAVETGPAGFSPLASAYFGFTVELDPATLDGHVWLVDVDRGERVPASLEWNAAGGGYWPARTLAVHADYQVPPRAGHRLAALILDGVKTLDGAPLEAPAIFARLDEASDPEAVALATVLPALPTLGLGREDVVAWTTWPTADPIAELRALAGWVEREAPPAATVTTLVERKANWDHYQGQIAITEAFSGEAPFTSSFGDGLIALGPDGAPATPRVVTIPFTLSVPRGPMPADGYPLVLYGHGLGETHEGFLRTAAAPLGARGVAVIGLDPPLQGTRNTTGIDDRLLIVNLSVGNIIGGREILRQGVFDTLQLARAVASAGFVVPAGVAGDGVELRFDKAKLGFFGHSEGAQIGALLLPLAPAIGPAVFSEGGGGAAITMLVLKLQEIDVSATVAEFLGVDLSVERWALGHPLVTAVIQPLLDAADPLHSARQIVREPGAGTPAHDLVMLEGFLDPLTPPVSIEALASAIGLPIAEPVGRPIAGLEAQHIASVALPASGNLPEVGGRHPTGALLQLPEEDHYIIYFNEGVRGRLMDFLASALAGAPVFE